MKKGFGVLIVTMILGLAFGRTGDAWPWDTTAPAKKASPAAAAPAKTDAKAAPAEEKASQAKPVVQSIPTLSPAELEKQRAQRDKKKGQLNNNQWDVDITPLSGKGAKLTDVLVFRDNKFSSDYFSKMGFAPSNFTVTIQDDGSVVVETMQSGEKEGIIFWRLELDKDLASCKGILSRQLADNKTEDFSFASSGKRPVLAQAPVAANEKDVKKDADNSKKK